MSGIQFEQRESTILQTESDDTKILLPINQNYYKIFILK